jgi:hypothetical protein
VVTLRCAAQVWSGPKPYIKLRLDLRRMLWHDVDAHPYQFASQHTFDPSKSNVASLTFSRKTLAVSRYQAVDAQLNPGSGRIRSGTDCPAVPKKTLS